MRATVRDLLAAFEPVDALEAVHARRMRALVDAPDPVGPDGQPLAPFDRGRFEPGHFTASAFVLSPDERSLLLILHGKLGRWLQPGGHIDAGDVDPVQAARREVEEETGLRDLRLASPGLFDVDVHAIPPLRGDPAHEHFDLRFLFVAPDLAHQAGSDAKAARWVPLPEVAGLESDESVLRAVRRLLP